jgi:ParB/RepB/Spo0J family partition protein
MTATMNGNGSVAGAQFRMVALSRIRVREGFNPRGERDPERVAQMNTSVGQEGILEPIIVAPDGEDYVLVAGEGRFNAAVEASQVEVPVIVREVDERTGGLEIAMAENLAREQLDAVSEARGFGGLRKAGWSVKQIADYFKPMKQKHVKGRLDILELDEQLHPQIADGTIPLGAVPALVKLVRIHRELPVALAGRVGVAKRSWGGEPLSWADVTRDPIGSLIFAFGDDQEGLPSDVYLVGESYPVSRFTLTEKAQKDLTARAKLLDIEDPQAERVYFRTSEVEQAKALGAVFSNEYDSAHIIVGQDVADQIVCDRIAESLKATRQMIRQRRQIEKAQQAAAAQGPPATVAPSAEDEAAIEEQERAAAAEELERERIQREQERIERERQREEAEGFNVQLGHAVFKHLSRLRIDADVLKLLASVEFAQGLPELAARGMRYGYPGWPIEPETDSKEGKRTYLSVADAGERASEWLAQAKSAPEIAGRLVSLLAMARYAKEKPLDISRRSWFRWEDDELLPWGGELLDMIDRLCKDRLPANLTKPARRELAQLRAATKRLERVEERIARMNADARAKVVEDARLVYGMGGHRYRIEALVRDTPLPEPQPQPEQREAAGKGSPEASSQDDATTSTEPSDADTDAPAESSTTDDDHDVDAEVVDLESAKKPEPVAQAA